MQPGNGLPVEEARIGLEGLAAGDPYRIRLFVNRPNADASTPDSDPGLAFTFDCKYETEVVDLLGDVTATVRQMYREGRDITLSLVPDDGLKLSGYEGLYLALFTQ